MRVTYKIVADGRLQPGALMWSTDAINTYHAARSFYNHFERKTNYLNRSIYILECDHAEFQSTLRVFFGYRVYKISDRHYHQGKGLLVPVRAG